MAKQTPFQRDANKRYYRHRKINDLGNCLGVSVDAKERRINLPYSMIGKWQGLKFAKYIDFLTKNYGYSLQTFIEIKWVK